MPVISVIMSVYNTPSEWLRESIESILSQTFSDFEFIIVLDCPTDGSDIVVNQYASKDKRINVVTNKTNKGLTENLYEAVKIAKGKYIARMDSDDISVSTRFEKQIDFLEKNNKVAVVGSYVDVFCGDKHSTGMINLGKDIETTKIRLLFSNSGVPHPSAMIRRSFLLDNNINYDKRYKKSQDYKLWLDIANCEGDIVLIPEILLRYRVHASQISNLNKEEQNDCVIGIVTSQLNKLLGQVPSDSELKTHFSLNIFNNNVTRSEHIAYIKTLLSANKNKGIYNKKVFKREILSMWQKISLRMMAKGHFSYLFSSLTIQSFALSVFRINIQKLKQKKQYSKTLQKFLSNNR